MLNTLAVAEGVSMSQPKIHDHFFKTYMTDTNYVKQFLKRNLDRKILAQLNLNQLKQIGTEFITKELKSTSADVLYETIISWQKRIYFSTF